MSEPPDARSGLPKAVEHRLTDRQTATGRIGAAALLRAMNVLVRQHPRAALHMFGAGIAQAARASVWEIRQRLPGKRSVAAEDHDGERHLSRKNEKSADIELDKKKLRQLERALKDAEREEREQ